jgi:hypothetical protein
VSDREREVLRALAQAFPDGTHIYWRDHDDELVVRALDEAGVAAALGLPSTTPDNPEIAGRGRVESGQMDLLERTDTCMREAKS